MTSAQPPASPASQKIRGLVPPGGFANTVGYLVNALDHGLEELKVRARRVPAEKAAVKVAAGARSAAEIVLHVAEVEGKWIHQGIAGQAPATAAPAGGAGLDALFAHLDAVRKASHGVLKPLVDRDLDTLREVPGKDGKTTVRRILLELLEHQAHHRGQLGLLARVLGSSGAGKA